MFNIKQFLKDNMNFIQNEFFVLMAALMAPMVSMLFLIGLLIVVDTFSGIWGAVKSNGWSGFKSRILSNGMLPKIVFYPLAILISAAIDREFPILYMTKVTGFLLMSIEFKSISENYKLIFGKAIFADLKKIIFRIKDAKVSDLFSSEDSKDKKPKK